MNRCVITLLAVLAVVAVGVGGSAADEEVVPVTTPPEDMIKRLTETIRKHCPEASIEVTKEAFIAKHDTMRFTLHGRGKDGVARQETFAREGPNYTGFILKVALRDHPYSGAAGTNLTEPRTYEEPYFDRYVHTPPAGDGKNFYRIDFHYGHKLDPKLKRAVIGVFPKENPQENESGRAKAPPPEGMVQKMTDAIRKHCPEAKIEVTKEAFIAKFETMMFNVHPRATDGELSREAQQVEGPNKGGFLLEMSLVHAGHDQRDIPQTLKEPYFEKFIDRPSIESGTKHYRIDFSYDRNLNRKLKQEIFDALPGSRFRQAD